MQYNSVHFIGAKDCPFTFRGQNLVEIRKARLRKIASALELSADGSKNDLLGQIIARGRALEAPVEITDWSETLA